VLQDFGSIGLLILVAFAFPFVALIVSYLLQTKKPTPTKLTAYECGMETIGPSWVQFKTSYFLYALVFVVFDIETVFLYPWAVKFQQLGTFALIEMAIFIAILVVGLGYAWRKGALEWK
jgi:NADH:ubiquinone oxidoreductase subunit 3 (subunit A)